MVIMVELTLAMPTRGRITKITWEAFVTLKATCVVEAVEAYASGSVTDRPQCWVNIAIALAIYAPTSLCKSMIIHHNYRCTL